jgi:HAD superfamily hydrolase (TIGR01509 family)
LSEKDHEPPVTAVVFDMDGVLLDSLQTWERVLSEVVTRHGGRWGALVEDFIVGGDNSLEWASFLRRRYGLTAPPAEIVQEVIERLLDSYTQALPLMPGAHEAVVRLHDHFRLGLASSSHPELIRYALDAAGISGYFEVSVSSDDVGHGKPRPDVYLRACELLGVSPEQAVAVEDSPGGLMSAHAAGLGAIAFPGPAFSLTPDIMRLAGASIRSLAQLTPEVIRGARRGEQRAS